jgi:hypothetical protein
LRATEPAQERAARKRANRSPIACSRPC